MEQALLPLTRSRNQLLVLGHLLCYWDREWSGPELRDETGVSQAVVSRELTRLADCGLINRRRVGNTLLVAAATDTAMFAPLRSVFMLAYGPIPVLAGLLAGNDLVDEAFIIGSWAARWHGTPGSWPRDVDVVVISEADAFAFTDPALAAEDALGVAVHLTPVTRQRWETDVPEGFVAQVRDSPVVQLDIGTREPLGVR